MRPAIYGAYHHITVMGKEDEPCDYKYDVTSGVFNAFFIVLNN